MIVVFLSGDGAPYRLLFVRCSGCFEETLPRLRITGIPSLGELNRSIPSLRPLEQNVIGLILDHIHFADVVVIASAVLQSPIDDVGFSMEGGHLRQHHSWSLHAVEIAHQHVT